VARRESDLTLRQGIQPPAVDTVAENNVEIARGEMFGCIFERRDDVMVSRPEIRLVGVGLDGPKLLIAEKFPLIVGCKDGASYKQDFLESSVVAIVGKDRFLENPAIQSVEWSRQTQSSPDCGDSVPSLGHEVHQALPSGIVWSPYSKPIDPVFDLTQSVLPPVHRCHLFSLVHDCF